MRFAMTASKTKAITANQLAEAVSAEASHDLAEAVKKIRQCLDQLNEEQVWWRAAEIQSSIGNLILHLCGNVRQWIVAGVGGAKDIRNRPEEFSERGPIPKGELLARLDQVVREATGALSAITADELLRVRRIQGYDVTALRSIFDSVRHVRSHTLEIVHMSQHLLSDAYPFVWKPMKPEQGAIEKRDR
jgi:hypothetical protein